MTPRRWFHALLGAVLVPLVSLPLVWGAALYHLRRAADEEARRWARRMLALAAVDTVVVAVAAGVVAHGTEPWQTLGGPVARQDQVVVGVMPDRAFGGPGARIGDVRPDGPAAAAGLKPGDVVLRVEGQEIAGADALRDVVGELDPDVPVGVEVSRDGSTFTASVTPRRWSDLDREAQARAPPVDRARACAPPLAALASLPLALVLAVLGLLGLLVTLRAPPRSARGVWWTGLSLVGAYLGGHAAAVGACAALGMTVAVPVVALWGSSLGLALTALAGRALVTVRDASAPSRTWRSAVALGSWYLVTGGLRVTVLAAGVTVLAGTAPAVHPVEPLAAGVRAAAGLPSLLLLAFAGVVLAPAGEELVFRGLLQPALGTWLRPAAAVAVTSTVFAAMHWFYGPKVLLVAFTAAVLGWARVASGGLRAPVVLHALVNAVGFLVLPR